MKQKMALRNYSLNPNKPSFSDLGDDDDIASAFMNSTSAKYLASEKMSPSYDETRAISEGEQRRNDLLQQLRQVEKNTLDSSKRSVGMLIESEKIGIETAQDLSRQREQLDNTEKRIDDINATLKDSQKNINGIKSVFSSLRQWWSAPKAPPGGDKADPKATTPVADSNKSPTITKNLASQVANSQSSLEFTRDSHPALRLRGLEEEEEITTSASSDFKQHSKRVNQQLDNDLDTMSAGLSRLKELAHGLGTEIGDQNALLERIHTKADSADLKITSQNTQMNKILKR